MYPNARRLFFASCLALITSAFSFQIRQDVADDVARNFSMTKELVGSLMGGQFLGMALTMLVFSFICDFLGLGTVLFFAFICHAIGITGTIFAADVAQQGFMTPIANWLASTADFFKNDYWSPMPSAGGNETAFWTLWAAAFVIGSANGLVEICINPLAATIYPDDKTHKLNVLHAWWPGGLILAGLIALMFINPLYGHPNVLAQYTIDPAKVGLADVVAKVPSWKLKYGLLYAPMVLYALLAIGQRFPATERVQARVSWGTMLLQILRPLFLIWMICMILTASTELGTNSWMESTLKHTAKVSGTLIFVYTSLLMFILRFFAGPIAHKVSPVGLLFFCSILAAGGLYLLSLATAPVMAFAAATVFGIGITYYWPTMLGVVAERFPKGGALLLGLTGFVGNIAVATTVPYMGAIFDRYTGAALPADVREAQVDGQPLTKAVTPPAWLREPVRSQLYPPDAVVVQPKVLALLPADATERKAVADAQVSGASNALRVTAFLPAALVVIFGLIAAIDALRGGYRTVKLTTPYDYGPPGDVYTRRP